MWERRTGVSEISVATCWSLLTWVMGVWGFFMLALYFCFFLEK